MIVVNQPSSLGYPNCNFSDVLSTAGACANWQQYVKDHPRFRDKMKSLVSTISRYYAPVDVMVQHSPTITALVWGFIRLLMLVCY